MISVTERCAKKVLSLAQREQKTPILRIGVQGGGCSGLSYFYDFAESVRENDTVLEVGGVTFVCDPKSLKFLENTEFDYETNLLKQGFRFINPQAKRNCSCGESFAL